MPKTPLNLIAHFRAKSGSEQALADALMACAALTRAEPGNVNYDLHRDRKDPAVYVLYEGWTGQDALDAHFQSPHFKTLVAALDTLAEHGPDGRPFTLETLAMISDLTSPKTFYL